MGSRPFMCGSTEVHLTNTSCCDELRCRLDEMEEEVNASIQNLQENKVDKEEGKGLSSNDYTDAEKTKLSNIQDNAEVNVQADWDEADSTSDAFIKNKPTVGDTVTYTQTQTTGDELGTITINGNATKIYGKDYSGKQNALVSGTNIKTLHNQSLLGSGNLVLIERRHVSSDNISLSPNTDTNLEIGALLNQGETVLSIAGIDISNATDSGQQASFVCLRSVWVKTPSTLGVEVRNVNQTDTAKIMITLQYLVIKE